MTKQTIYIIDDDKEIINLLIEYARLLGYQPCAYTDAAIFFAEYAPNQDDAVMILDLNMPGMDGVEVMREMASKGIALPLILSSGYDSGVLHSAEQLAKAYALDIIASLKKPFKFNTFKRILQDYRKSEQRYIQPQYRPITVAEWEAAISEEQLLLHYQPQIDIKTGAVIGVEALVRWMHPQHGLIYPDLFISMAEDNGLIGDLTALVVKQAVECVLSWQNKNIALRVSVNISAENITSLSLPEQFTQLLKENNLNPSMLMLEVTETALMEELVTFLDILTRLRMKGIELSIDDFGTGFSSLSQLYRVPFTELKVDQSFVMSMTHDSEARGIVKTCIRLGHELNMKVVAEGVENQEVWDQLVQLGCDIAQGYFIAKPMPPSDFLEWFKQR